MILELLAALTTGYLIGGVPTAALVARSRGTSIFSLGSGNMGAMNTARHLGPIAGVAVLLVDVAKGAAATAAGLWVAGAAGATSLFGVVLALVAGFGAVLGHAWSPYARFRGGKALATMLGVSLPLYPLGGACGLLLLVASVLLIRRTTVASIATLALYPAVVLWTLRIQRMPEPVASAIVAGVVSVVAISVTKHLLALRRGVQGA